MVLFIFIIFSLAGLFAFSIYVGNKNIVSDGILAITGIVVAWYAYVASETKREMVTQRKLSSTPFVLIEEKDRKFYLKNYGTAAMNVEISGVKLDKYDTFIFPKILFIAPNEEIEIIGKTGRHFIDQNVFVYWEGKFGSKFEIQPSIQYDDLTGQRYETLMKVGKGDHKIIHRKEL
jgi:hypothetical protein